MSNNIEYWLIRDPKNWIHGPYTREEIVSFVKSRKIKASHELCLGNSYWFHISEVKELMSFLPELSEDLGHLRSQDTQTIVKDGSTEDQQAESEWLSEEHADQFAYEDSAQSGTSVASKKKEVSDDFDTNTGIDFPEATDEPTLIPQSEEVRTEINIATDQLDEKQSAEAKNKKLILIAGVVIIVAILVIYFVDFYFSSKAIEVGDEVVEIETTISEEVDIEKSLSNLKVSLLLNNMGAAQKSIANLDKQGVKASALLIAKALLRKHFLLDDGGAIRILEKALKGEMSGNETAEVYNLLGLYNQFVDNKKGIQYLRQAFKMNQNDVTYRFNLAIAYFSDGQLERATKLLTTIISNNEGSKTLQAKSYFLAGALDSANASKFYIRALELDPNLDVARISLALSYLKTKQFSKGKVELMRFIDDIPALSDSLNIKNFRIADFDFVYPAVRKEIRAIMSQYRSDPLFMSTEGMLSVLLGDFVEAAKSFDHALTNDPGNEYALRGLAYLKFKQGKPNEVISLLNTKELKKAKSFAIHMFLGRSYLKIRKSREAAQHFQVLINRYKTRSHSWSLAAKSALVLGMQDQAEKFLQRAIAINPYDAVAVRTFQTLGRGKQVNSAKLAELLPLK